MLFERFSEGSGGSDLFLNGDGKVLEDLFIVLNKKLHLFVQFFLEKKTTRFYTTTVAMCSYKVFYFRTIKT